MRLTNLMMSNTTLHNINRNQNAVNQIMNQITTRRQITNPSENPLIAARHIRFENSRAQIAQFQRNVHQAEAWMTTTESAAERVNISVRHIEEIIHRVDVLETLSERQIIANDIRQTVMGIKDVMNTNFSGRYIFSGLRTDQPPFFTTNEPDLILTDITLDFAGNDIHRTTVLNRVPPLLPAFDVYGNPIVNMDDGHTLEIYRIRVPHNNAENMRLNGSGVLDVPLYEGFIDYNAMSDTGVYHNPKTGELISRNRENFLGPEGETQVVYDRTGFLRNELNPIVFMTVTIPGVPNPAFDPSEPEFFPNPDYDGTDPDVPATIPNPDFEPPYLEGYQTINMDNQNMEFEFSINTRIPVNMLGKNLISPIMLADLLGVADDILNITPTTHADLIARGMYNEEDRVEFLRREMLMIETETNDLANRFIGRLGGYLTTVSRTQTEHATRMQRIDTIAERLEADAVVFEQLYVDNIGVNIIEASMRFSAAEVALLASMQIGVSHVINLSLINFL